MTIAQHLRARPAATSNAPGASRARASVRSRATSTAATTSAASQPIDSLSGVTSASDADKYYGTYLGRFEGKVHGVTGQVFAVDESTLFVKHFTYDGAGPDAYFWAGTVGEQPDTSGFIVPDEKGRLVGHQGHLECKSALRLSFSPEIAFKSR